MILGTVTYWSATAGVRVQIDGETEPTEKVYLILSSYAPANGDRVLIEQIGDEYVILGKVTNNLRTAKGVFQVANRISNPDDGNVVLGIRNGNLWFGLAPSDGSSVSMTRVANAT